MALLGTVNAGGAAPFAKPPVVVTGTGTPIPLAPQKPVAPTPMTTLPWTAAHTYAGDGVTPGAITGPGGLLGPVNGPGDTHTVFPSVNPGGPNVAPPSAASNPFNSDPGYAAAHAAETLGIPTITGTLQDEIARRLTQWGDASFASQAGFGVDPQAAAFARQNYLSGNAELARLDHAHQLARQAIINRLAGHGLLFSGDTGYLTGQEDQGYGNQVYDGQQKVLGDLYGYQQSALGQKAQLHAATTAALENAFTNAANHPGLYGDGTTTPTTTTTTKPPTTTAKTPAPKAKATKAAIINTYTTGRKRFG